MTSNYNINLEEILHETTTFAYFHTCVSTEFMLINIPRKYQPMPSPIQLCVFAGNIIHIDCSDYIGRLFT